MARKGNSALRYYASKQAENFCGAARASLNLPEFPTEDWAFHKLARRYGRLRRMEEVACDVAKRMASDLL